MLNREKIAAALALLVLIFGVYRFVVRQVAAPPAPIATDPPPAAVETPRVEPAPFVPSDDGVRNPFKQSSDWRPLTAADLPPPPMTTLRFLALPPAGGIDPADAGFTFLGEPPVEIGKDNDAVPDEKSAPASGTKGGADAR